MYATDGDETLGGSDLDLCLYNIIKNQVALILILLCTLMYSYSLPYFYSSPTSKIHFPCVIGPNFLVFFLSFILLIGSPVLAYPLIAYQVETVSGQPLVLKPPGIETLKGGVGSNR